MSKPNATILAEHFDGAGGLVIEGNIAGFSKCREITRKDDFGEKTCLCGASCGGSGFLGLAMGEAAVISRVISGSRRIRPDFHWR